MNKKLAAFTLLEITIAMLLSAIVVTLCYTAFGLIEKYHTGLQDKYNRQGDMGRLDLALKKDFLRAGLVSGSADSLMMSIDNGTIAYVFKNTFAVRRHSFHADTFFVQIAGKDARILEIPNGQTAVIDSLGFHITSPAGAINYSYTKRYASSDLFKP